MSYLKNTMQIIIIIIIKLKCESEIDTKNSRQFKYWGDVINKGSLVCRPSVLTKNMCIYPMGGVPES